MNRLILGFLLVFVQGCLCQESGETETVRFTYEGHTHTMVVTRQATCYIFILDATELSMVHNDATLRQLELKFLAKINDPALATMTIPDNTLHSNIHKECGRDMTNYYLVQ